MLKLLIVSVLFAGVFLRTEGVSYSLSHVSTLYVPASYTNFGSPVYEYDEGAAEQIAYDPRDKLAYIVGGSNLHIVDVSNPTNLTILQHIDYPGCDVTDIEFCGDHVFFAIDNQTSRLNGTVYVLNKYMKNSANSLQEVHTIKVGAVPDMIKPTKDCRTVLVAVEAEAFGKNDDFVDPPGGVGIIRFPNGVTNAYTYNELSFRQFNDKFAELESQGVRFVYRGRNNTFDRDIEPEYITYNTDESIAYIGLQENNAIAEVNLLNSTITAIHGLGYKSWKNIKFDASDEDGGIHLRNYDIRSFYLPDSIHFDTWRSTNIMITANEGDVKDYEDNINWTELQRGKKFDGDLSSSVSTELRTALGDDNLLGRLEMSKVDGKDASGKFTHLYAYGGRGLTIRSMESGLPILYDSAGVVEEQIAKKYPLAFNSNAKKDKTIQKSFDKRSDARGPECESLATTVLGGRLVIFLGSERPGSISIFSVGNNFTDVRHEETYLGIPEFNTTVEDMFNRRVITYVDPEDLKFLPADESPTDYPVLLVAGSVSGTFTILKVNVDGLPPSTGNTGSGSVKLGSTLSPVLFLTAVFVIISRLYN